MRGDEWRVGGEGGEGVVVAGLLDGEAEGEGVGDEGAPDVEFDEHGEVGGAGVCGVADLSGPGLEAVD